MRTTGSPQELATLYRRMAQAMAQLKRLPKRGRNTHFGYDYVTDSDVLDAVRGALGAAGVAFFTDVVDMSQDGKRTELTLDAMFADSETGASMTVTWIGEALDSQDKGINKALTAAVKYGLLKTLLVSTGEDDPDGEPEPDKGNGHEQAKPHWIEDAKVRARFWAWTKDKLALSEVEVHDALGVASVKEFAGSMDDAKVQIETWISDRAKEAAGE